MQIQKRNGLIVEFDKERIILAIYKASKSVGIDDIELVKSYSEDVVKKVEEKYPTAIPNVEDIQDIIEGDLIAKEQTKIAKAYILYRQKRTELRKTKQTLLNGLIDDSKLSLNGLLIAKERYLLRDEHRIIIETPLQLFRRVAKTSGGIEKRYGEKKADEYEEKFYNIISTLKFLPAGRILANAGTKNRMMYSSFVIGVPDSMKGIFKALLEKALIQRLGGGIGFSFSRLRQRATPLQSYASASGPVAFIDLFDHASRLTVQKGKRLGANMGSLSIEHPDIIDFITAKDRLGLESFNISVEVTDDFMEAVEKNKYYELKDPATKLPLKKIKAKQVFDILVFMAWKNADPGILFIDRINKDNPLTKLGKIETTDPCGDQPLTPYDGCPIGAINLAKFVGTNKSINWNELSTTTKLSVRFLDNIIDASRFPLSAIEKTVLANRRIGIGVMGWADMLYQLKICYESEEGYELAEKVAKFLRDTVREESENLANERGVFPNFKNSIFKTKQRNASLLAIAPTGSRSILAETSPGIEPHFALGYRRTVFGSIEISYLNQYFETSAKEEGFFSEETMKVVGEKGSIQNIDGVPQKIKKVFVTAHDISPEGHIRMQSSFQKYVDNAISKTINFPEDVTITDVEKAYFLAWKLGCKGITVYRDKSKENQIINISNQ
ncbi:MAG: adenosylcobalamin-dependent ribonucleoside-diphosphate reductase [Nanoarchaeota archaeon]